MTRTWKHEDQNADGSCGACAEDVALNGDGYSLCATPEPDDETTALLDDGDVYCYCGHALVS